MTTLPPRLTDRTFPPEPGAAERLLARARRRRTRQAGTVLGVTASVAVLALAVAARPRTDAVRPVTTPPTPSLKEVQPMVRGVVPYEPEVRCDASGTERFGAASYRVCLRYSFPATVRAGEGATFHVQWCVLDTDFTPRQPPWPRISVTAAGWQWSPRGGGMVGATLRARTCWDWEVPWDGRAERFDVQGVPSPGQAFPPGSYEVRIAGPAGGSGTHDPAQPRTLTIR